MFTNSTICNIAAVFGKYKATLGYAVPKIDEEFDS